MYKAKGIKYANCWEDADLLLQSKGLSEGGTILSIASGGDNTLALLSTSPSKIIAVDMNLAQLHLTELKIVAFKNLEYEQLLGFLGVNTMENRNKIYFSLNKELSIQAQTYWNENIVAIKTGIIHSGKFENYFAIFRKYIMPFIHSKKRIEELLQPKTEAEQKEFFEKKWNSLRWKAFTSLFFSKFVMGNLGRTSSYLKQVEIVVSEFIKQQSAAHLSSVHCQKNGFLNFIFKGTFGNELPFYLRRENFEIIRQNIGKVELIHGTVESCMKEMPKLDFCNFSNIFEYMTKEQFRDFTQQILPALNKEASLSYWNLMVDRVFPDEFSDIFKRNNLLIDVPDKGFFYKQFINCTKI